ncbi:MAG: hypothetical protein SPD82_10630 [Prevotella sp.]|nr:hypothetical protein [Prevotella sp.]
MILQGESYEFGTVFQTVAFFMFVIPRLRPGLNSLRSVLSSRQILLLCWLVALLARCLLARCLLDIACWISLVGSLLFGNIGNQPNNKITKQQDNKTTKKTRIATFIFDGAFIAQE